MKKIVNNNSYHMMQMYMAKEKALINQEEKTFVGYIFQNEESKKYHLQTHFQEPKSKPFIVGTGELEELKTLFAMKIEKVKDEVNWIKTNVKIVK